MTNNKLGHFPGLLNFNQSEIARNVHTMLTWSVGFDADVTDNWHLKGTWQSGRSHKYTASYGEVHTDRLFLALDTYQNIAKTAVRGIDYKVQYTAHPDFVSSLPESFVVRGFASQLIERSNKASSTGRPTTSMAVSRPVSCTRPGRPTSAAPTRWATGAC